MKQNYNDIVSKYSSNIGLTPFEEIAIETDPEVIKPYPLPQKHHTFAKKEIKNLLEARLIERSMNPYARPMIIVPSKRKPGLPLAQTKRLVIDYRELNKLILKVQTTQTNQRVSLALIETT